MKNAESHRCGSIWVNILILLIEAVKSIARTKSNANPKLINGLTGRMRVMRHVDFAYINFLLCSVINRPAANRRIITILKLYALDMGHKCVRKKGALCLPTLAHMSAEDFRSGQRMGVSEEYGSGHLIWMALDGPQTMDNRCWSSFVGSLGCCCDQRSLLALFAVLIMSSSWNASQQNNANVGLKWNLGRAGGDGREGCIVATIEINDARWDNY